MSGGVLKSPPTPFQQNSRQHAKLGMLNRPHAIPAEAPLLLRAVLFRANSSDTPNSRPRGRGVPDGQGKPCICCDPP